MAQNKRGGARKGAGRPIGGISKATRSQKATLSELARAHTSTALGVLVEVAKKGESESARVAAANALLDRAYGKPSQSHEHSGPGGAPIQTMDVTKLTDEQFAALEAAFGISADDDGSDQGEAEAGAPEA